ncbi:hypothetical protein [Gordonia phthalatica]|uniref:3-hydroxyacyl-CoA dehydrogenase n=1 Tax=Gordonia phthalatica TaxID=1136941 RepID=A0A0N9MR13_9ACTN|nr:hypothetical protein [Gordonia phthalatica]ALG85340.1 hypothetical protein ACH46_13715 [Gordonia phthalatica]
MTAMIALGLASRSILSIDVDDGSVRTILSRDGAYCPDGVAVVGDTVYWTTMGKPAIRPDVEGEAKYDYSAADGGLHAIGLDGSGRRDLLPSGTIVTGKQLVSDGTRLYWGDREGRRVSSCRPDGSDVADLIVNPAEPDRMAECVGVAVADGYLYWTQKGPSKGGRGRIFRAGLAVPDGQPPESRTDVELLWDSLPEPIDLAVADGHLYWTDRGAEPNGNTLNRALLPMVGQPGAEPEILARGLQEAIGLAVDAAAGVVYVSDLGGTIRAVALDGTGDRVVVDLGEKVTGVALT